MTKNRAIQVLREMKNLTYVATDSRCSAIDMAIEALKDRSSGEWKWTHGGQCSECGFHNTNFDFNFCPNCGADMRGEDDG